jgi:hypothetical protein
VPSTVHEDGRRLEQRPLGVVEQADAPAHRCTELVLALRHVHRACPERIERSGQAAHERIGFEQSRARGGELDGERQALQASADLDDRSGVGGRQSEVGPHGSGAVEEQGHGRRRRQVVDRHRGRVGRERQRRDRVLALGP